MSDRKTIYFILIIIMFLALAVRIYPLRAGLPYTYWHDENNYIEDALRMGGGNLKPYSYAHGGLYQLILCIIYGAYFVLLKISGSVTSPTAFIVSYFRDPSVFFMIGRMVSILCGTALVYLSYAVAARIFSMRAALASAIFTAFSLLMFQMSIFALADMLAVALLAAAFLCVVLSVKNTGERGLYYTACILAGLAAAAKYHCVFGAAFLYVAAYIKYRESSPRSIASLGGMLSIGSILIAAGFFIGIPSALFNMGSVYQDVARLGDSHIATNPHAYKWLYYFTNHMKNGWGIPLEMLSLCGIGYALYKRTRWDMLLMAFPIAQYMLFMNTTGFAYHIIPSTFFIFILAGRLIDDLLDKTPFKGAIFPAALAASLIVYPSFIDSVKLIKVVRSPDTRTIAKSWIESNVKAGSSILEEGCLFGTAIGAPQLVTGAMSVKRDLDEAIAMGGSGSLQKIKMSHYDGLYTGTPLYDITKVDKLKEEDMRAADYSHVIVTASNDMFISDELRYFVAEGYREKRNAVKNGLAKKYMLEKSFVPTVEFDIFFPHLTDQDYRALRTLSIVRSKDIIRGPQIDIYRRKKAGAP